MTRIILLSLLAGAGCTVEPFDFEGLGCPCPQERACVCEGTPSERCVLPGEDDGCAMDRDAATDALTSDAAGDAFLGCSGDFRISALYRDWRTDDTIAIGWTVDTMDESLFDHYEVELTSQDGERRLLTPRENPELGEYELDRDSGIVQRTLLRGLESSTSYQIRLIAFDSSGGACELSIRAITVATERRGSRSIFTEESAVAAPIDYINPGLCAEIETTDPFEGERRLRLVVDCDACRAAGNDACYVNIMIGLVPNVLPEDYRLNFSDARLRFAIRLQGGSDASSDSALLRVAERGGREWVIRGFTIPYADDYQIFQIPLLVLRAGDDAPNAGDIRDPEFVLLGGAYTDGVIIDLDSVEIVW